MKKEITNEEYEKAQQIVWDYEAQIEKKANARGIYIVEPIGISDIKEAVILFNDWAAKENSWYMPAGDDIIDKFLNDNLI